MYVIQLFINAVFVLGMAHFFSNVIQVSSFLAALLAAFLISVLNVFLRPILVFLTLPVTILSFGLFLLVINALMVQFVDVIMGQSFNVTNFTVAFLLALCLSLLNLIFQTLIIEPYQAHQKKRF